ncbi:DHA2 family efflux MFS transporter permease subunit [Peribacillus sp. SI8-4]|uniref:DHA2 family efflux MFS transporter permease subunit n=1 Tax=Peribacillus sp. SI8-4 TaxID=3048009 RepID=UPI002555CE48|nr:DHA2 family efflux MFS transporter permease subunit [Peribacillus sp. SI8-4]
MARIQLDPKLVVSIVYVIAMFMVSMDGTIVNVILPTISQEFNIDPSSTSGINVGYLVSLAVFLPVAGWLGDRFGTKKIFLMALGVFTGASLLCGFANDLQTLNLFRVLQGAGGGILTPVGMALLFRTFSPEERPRVSRSLVLPIAFAPAIGPIVGGFFAEQLSWRWAFYINVPFGILVLVFGLLFLKEHKEPAAGRLDVPGFLLSAAGFSMLMYALNVGPAKGWDSAVILFTGITGVVLVCIFILLELKVDKPMLDLRLLSDRLFRTLGIISLFSMAGLLGMLFVFPLMYQSSLQASALESGLTTFPEALGLMVSSRLMPWTTKKLGIHQVIRFGLLGTIIIFTLISLVGPTANPWFLRALLFSIGICLGHTVVAVQFSTFTNIGPASMGRATTLFNVQNRIGSAIGVAILASILGAVGTSTMVANGETEVHLASYQIALLGSAAFLFAALLFALRLTKDDFKAMSAKAAAKPRDVKQVRSVSE